MLLVVLAVALLFRTAALLATPHLALAGDPHDYDRHARAIALTGHYPPSLLSASGPTAIRPPAYPYVLGTIYAVAGPHVLAGRAAQVLIGTCLVGLLFLVAAELYGLRTAAVAGALAAVFPPLIIDGITLFSEPLFVCFVLAAMLCVLRWRRVARLRWLVVAGLLCGLALLTRSNAVFVLLALAFGARVKDGGRLASLRGPAVLMGCALLTIIPWTVRNYVEFKALVPVTDQDGVTLAGTYNSTSYARDAIWIPAFADPAMRALYVRSRHRDEVQLSAEFRRAARRFAVHHPAYVVETAGRNLLRLFNLGGATYERDVAHASYGLGAGWGALLTWSLVPVLLLAFAGAFTLRARRTPRWIWAVPGLLLLTVFVLAGNRHRAAIDPFLVLLAALALTTGLRPDLSRFRAEPGR